MSYQVLARKWRPKNFEELLGQNSARQTLTNALSKDRLYPVLIFTGPRGTGKTSTARIVAKSLRCQNKKLNNIPCEACEDCISISNSNSLDVIEIDGASNNGVEAVRELRDKVSYMPSTGDWKIYIIDEVHMLSNSAFNALLKTLEEPPKHVVFIMATTESHKIPLTVLSRCQKIDFHLLSPLIIKNHLEEICKKESFPISENLLWLLARQAQGSLRDAQSLLDQLVTFCGAEVEEEEARRLLGLSDPQILEDTLKALILGEEAKIIPLIAKLRHKSSRPKIFLENLLSSVSHLLFLKKNPSNDPPLLPLSQEEIERKKKLISLISYEQLHFLFDILLKGEREMSLSHDSELVLEVLLLRICSANQIEALSPFSPQNQSSQNSSPSSSRKNEKPTKTNSQNNSPNSSSQKEILKFSFQNQLEFLDYLKKREPLLGSLVDHLSFKQKSQFEFIVCIPKQFSYLKKKLEDRGIQKKLEQELSLFLNLNQKVQFLYQIEEHLEPSLKQEKEKREKAELFKQAEENPFIQDLGHIFKGKIHSVKRIDKEEL